jgi:hypothetical protein
VALQNPYRLLRACSPNCDPAVLPAGNRIPVAQQRHCIDRAGMEPQHLFGGISIERPSDRRTVEASGKRAASFCRDRDCTHRPAMAPQLGLRQ